MAGAAFALLSLSQTTLGFSANAEHFVLLPAMAGMWMLLRALEPPSPNVTGKKKMLFFFFAGLFLGIAYTMKQHAMFFIGFGGLYVLFTWYMQKPLDWKKRIVNGLVLGCGVIIPPGIICLIFLSLGLFQKFWWWTFVFPRLYISQMSLQDGLGNFTFSFLTMWEVFWPLFLLLLTGVVSLIRKRRCLQQKVFALGFFVFSFLAVCPGFYFYAHYFLLAMPAAGIVAAAGAESIGSVFRNNSFRLLKEYAGVTVVTLACLLAISKEKEYLFSMDGAMVSRSSFGVNPFPESLEIARHIAQNTRPEDKIAVIGSEP